MFTSKIFCGFKMFFDVKFKNDLEKLISKNKVSYSIY